MRRLLFFGPAAIFVVIVGIFLNQLLFGGNPSLIPSALIDQPAPDFVLPAVVGRVGGSRDGPDGFSTGDLKGEITLVNVFAAWCVPCLAEHPQISRLADDGYRIFGLNHRDKDANAAAWLRRNGDPYDRIGADPDGRVSVEWGVTGIPETYIIDRDGVIRYKFTGPMTVRVLKDEILPRLKELGG